MVEMKIQGAAIIMQELFKSGKYFELKQLEHKLDSIKEEIKSRMEEDEKRGEFPNGVIAKYTSHNTYEVDTLGLKSLLKDLGILVKTAKIEKDTIDLYPELAKYAKEQTYHIRFFPNKLGKTEKLGYNFKDTSDEALSLLWLETKKQLEEAQTQIENAKRQMLQCEVLDKEGKLQCDYGTVSKVKNKLSYDTEAICIEKGIDFIVQYGKVCLSELEENYVTEGFISPNEIKSFKKLTNISLKFTITTKESEEKVYWVMNQRKQRLINSSLEKALLTI